MKITMNTPLSFIFIAQMKLLILLSCLTIQSFSTQIKKMIIVKKNFFSISKYTNLISLNYICNGYDEIKIDKHAAKYNFENKDYNSGISDKHYYHKIRIS